ncbi:hypothetical protein GH714_038881 [Hevea brasiliensis]|uniref:Uncharacterized protein n=1 Tax=Hevea brasiliensis TaxID=3981 RepID=A0A6A6KMX6_HEVBR|nr:hypothetical protein GH714_038881 [Hevea brasiliensis]
MIQNMDAFNEQIIVAEQVTYGIIINSFKELKLAYIQEIKKVKGNKVWCIGPISLYDKNNLDKLHKGDKASIEVSECFKCLIHSTQVVDVMKIGVRVGTEFIVLWGQEEKVGVLVTREAITRAIDRLMDERDEDE